MGMDKADSQHNGGFRFSNCMVSTFLEKLRFLDFGLVTPFVPPARLEFLFSAQAFLTCGLLCIADKSS
jgi:hypothetical protein